MLTGNREKWITLLLFLAVSISQLPFSTNSPFEYNSWRQSDTESIARNFVEHRFNIFYPQLNYDGPAPNYVQLEFQITTYLIAILYKLFGYHYFLARIIPILFFVGSAFFLYLIAKRYYSLRIAWLTVILYDIFPLNLFFARAIMPESAALFFFTGSFYFFSIWWTTEKRSYLWIAALFTALAISQKIPTIFVGLPLLMMAIQKYRSKVFIKGELWLFAVLSLLPPYAYYSWIKEISEFDFVSGIADKHIYTKFYTAIFTPESLSFFYQYIPKSFTWIGILLFVLGLLVTKRGEWPIYIWTLAMLLEWILIVAVIKFDYYLIFMSPLIALLGAKGLEVIRRLQVRSIKIGVLLLVISLGFMGYSSLTELRGKFLEYQDILKQASIVKQITDKKDLIAVGTINPALLNASERFGWRANIKYYDYIPKEPQQELAYFIRNGAKYFVPLRGKIYGDDGSYKKYLDTNFEKIVIEEGYEVYKLQ